MKKTIFLLVLVFLTTFSFGQFSRKFDKFENETICSYQTPNIYFTKYIKPGDTTYQTCFTLYDTYLTLNASDAILLFSDGTKMELEGKVDFDYSSSGKYSYSFYSYDYEVMEKLYTTLLVGFKLHIFEKNILPQNRNLIKMAANKILLAK